MYALWDQVENDPSVPAAARFTATSAARALYIFGFVGGAFAFAVASMGGAKLLDAIGMSPDEKLGAVLAFGPAVLAALLTWRGMRALQILVFARALAATSKEGRGRRPR